MNKFILGLGILSLILSGFVVYNVRENIATGQSLRLCTVSESRVAIGHQAPTTIVSAGTREWVIVQQVENATNTVSLSLSGSAVAGSGYLLSTSSSMLASEFRYGYGTPITTSNALSAISGTGSTSLNVISCR